MGASGTAEMLAFRTVGEPVFPWGEFERGLTAPGVERRRALIGGDPPLLFHTCLLLAAYVARETFNPNHRVLYHPVNFVLSLMNCD